MGSRRAASRARLTGVRRGRRAGDRDGPGASVVPGGASGPTRAARDAGEPRVEADARDREGPYRTLFEAIDEGFDVAEVVRDAEGRVTDVRTLEANPAFERMVGIAPGSAAGRTVRDLVPGLDDGWVDALAAVALEGVPRRFEGFAGPLGRWFDLDALPLGDRHAGRLAIVIRDTTEQHRTEARLRTSEARERKAREAAEAFLGVMSHELKTPVTSIYGTATLLTRNADRLEELAGDMVEESFRLTRIVDDLLVLSGVERGLLRVSPEPLLVSHGIAEVVAEVQRRFPAVEVVVRTPPMLPTVLADATAFRQVVTNLLTNAAKYAGDAGPVRVVGEVAGDAVAVRVIDDGPGPGPDPEKLFELFYRAPHTERIASGTGIGLYVARELAVAMGGALTGAAAPGGGAEFRLLLPIDRADTELVAEELGAEELDAPASGAMGPGVAAEAPGASQGLAVPPT